MFQIIWAKPAETELFRTSEYILDFFSLNELIDLTAEVEHITKIIAKNPKTFKLLEGSEDIRYVVILKYNTLYYLVDNHQKLVRIISFFSNRQHSDQTRLKSKR